MKKILFLFLLISQFSVLSYATKDDEFEEVKKEEKQSVLTEKSIDTQTIRKHESLIKDIWDNRIWLVFALTALGTFVFFYRQYRFRFVFMLVSVVFLGFYQGGCTDSVGASIKIFPNIVNNNHWMFAAVLLAIPIFISLFAGRTFCSSACPLGALQEFMAAKDKMFRVSYKTEQWMRRIRIVFFIFLVVLSLSKSIYFFETIDPFKAIFNLMGNSLQWILAGFILLLSLFLYRPFCRYFCPLSLWLKVASQFSLYQIKNQENLCVNCGLCQKTCPVSVINENNQIDNSECIRCGKCLEVCPKKSLSFTKNKEGKK